MRQAAKGAGISGLNPKVFLLFLALLPQFTDPDVGVADRGADRGAGTGARGQLRGGLHRGGHRGPAGAAGTAPAARAVTRFSGAAMTVIGVVLLVEQLIG